MSNIKLIMEPGTAKVSWEEFCTNTPPYSIALDGYVADGPKFSSNGPHINLNHHENVDRLATRSTCAQVLMSIRQGLFTRFRNKDGIVANIYVNDCDEDVCTSWFLLNNSHLSESIMNPLLNRLVSLEDALDCTAGAYPFPIDLPALTELAWVFEPYRRFRNSGGLERRDTGEFTCVVTDVEHRIMQHITGRGKSISLDTRYDIVGGGKQWKMVREIGAQSRTGMFADKIEAFVSVKDRKDGKYSYTIGRLSSFIPFDVLALADHLNKLENTDKDNWGGATNIIGSPRVGGSSITPDHMERIVESFIHV